MTKKQTQAINAGLRYVTERSDKAVTAVTHEIKETDYGTVWLTITVKRTDCHPDSPRAVICEEYGHFEIRKGGRVIPMAFSTTKGDAARAPFIFGMNTIYSKKGTWYGKQKTGRGNKKDA